MTWAAPAEARPTLLRVALAAVAATSALALGVSALVAPAALAVGQASDAGVDYWDSLPSELPLDVPLPGRTQLLDRDGTVFATLFSQDRVEVPLSDISPLMRSALIDTEDVRFYEHGPADLRGTARAAVNNAAGGATQGASTLTQQLVENIRILNASTDAEREDARAQDIPGKIVELRLATVLEQQLSKDEILERYLNTVYFGSGTYGVSSAAARFFSKAPADLSLTEAATIAGLVQSPVSYDPLVNPDAALTRRNTVLSRMLSAGTITAAEHDAAVASPLGTNPSTPPNGCAASSQALYCEAVKIQMLNDPAFGDTAEERQATFESGGLTVATALDPRITAVATDASRRALDPTNRVAAAAAVVEPGNGLVRALAQNRPYGSDEGAGQTQIVYAAAPAFQTGSTFKPITLAAALEAGTPADLRQDAPSPYTPPNADAPRGGFRNDFGIDYAGIDSYTAMRESVNTWFVKLAVRTGVKDVAATAALLGDTSIPTPDELTGREAAITLGTYETSPLQMASVYATFAAHGLACRPVLVTSVTRTATGEQLESPDPACEQVIRPEVADRVTDVLRTPFEEGGTAAGLGLDRPAAGKTGTTDDGAGGSSATWFVGYTPQIVTAVWVGDPRGGQRYPLRNINAYGKRIGNVFGSSVAAPIWKDAMTSITAGLPAAEFTSPGSSSPLVLRRAVVDVRGLSLPAATSALAEAGSSTQVAPERASPDGLASPGQVMAQSPAPGTVVPRGTAVTLTLSADSTATEPPPVKETP